MRRHLDHRPKIGKAVVDTTDLGLSSVQIARLKNYLDGDRARTMRIGFEEGETWVKVT